MTTFGPSRTAPEVTFSQSGKVKVNLPANTLKTLTRPTSRPAAVASTRSMSSESVPDPQEPKIASRSPSRILTVSLPVPASKLSSPSPPTRVSLPAPPSSRSSPVPPFSVSLPPKPRSSSLPPLPFSTSLPEVPHSTSRPGPPFRFEPVCVHGSVLADALAAHANQTISASAAATRAIRVIVRTVVASAAIKPSWPETSVPTLPPPRGCVQTR